jgi:hypothetical protein
MFCIILPSAIIFACISHRIRYSAKPVFAFNPGSCSRSPRNAVRNHPEITFILSGFPNWAGAGPSVIRLFPYRRVADCTPEPL